MVIKASNTFEQKARNFGYGVHYQNVNKEAIGELPNPFIIALDKHHYNLTPQLEGATIVIHDSHELQSIDLDFLRTCRVISIRKEIQQFMLEKHNIKSEYLYHPFYEYPTQKNKNPDKVVSISRVDFDKHTDIILDSNRLGGQQVDIYGAVNRLYIYHKLDATCFGYAYKGQFGKDFNSVSKILSDARFVVDMTEIKGDGGGTQYTFLEAIHQNVPLILNRAWLMKGGDFVEGVNCYAADNGNQLNALLEDKILDTTKIVRNARKLLKRHTSVNWAI